MPKKPVDPYATLDDLDDGPITPKGSDDSFGLTEEEMRQFEPGEVGYSTIGGGSDARADAEEHLARARAAVKGEEPDYSQPGGQPRAFRERTYDKASSDYASATAPEFKESTSRFERRSAVKAESQPRSKVQARRAESQADLKAAMHPVGEKPDASPEEQRNPGMEGGHP